jgi:predicted flap endonuclease-1-like 5' DNA nuclease
MEYLIATYWLWSVVAVLVGAAVGYLSPWQRKSEGGMSSLSRWGAVGFAIGLVVAFFHWLPQRAGLYLETLLLLSFWYAVGGLLSGWLRGAMRRTDFATTIGAGNPEFAGARAATRTAAAPNAGTAAVTKAAEEARAAVTAQVVEDSRLAEAAKAAEDARAAAAVKVAEDARLAAAAKAAEEGAAAAIRLAEDARLAVAAKAAEEVRAAAPAKLAEDARPAAAATAADGARDAAVAKVTEDVSVAAAESELYPGHRPQGIVFEAAGKADDLKLIKGIGPKNEKACNELGVYQFHQIADWTPDEAIWVGHHIAFPGRIEREQWIAQAKLLASGGDTDHSSAVKSGTLVVDDAADAPLDAIAVETLEKTLPRQAATVGGEGDHPGRRPYGLAQALGQADDLKRIRGIGPQNEGRLHGLGIWHFAQIAAWSGENARWVGSYLAFSGRIDREKWIDQARALAIGQDTEFSSRVAAGKVATSKDDGSLGRGNVQILK